MKRFILTVIRSTFYGIGCITFPMVFLLIYNYVKAGHVIHGITCGVGMLIIAIVLYYVACITKPVNNLAELKEEYSDVKHFQKYHILFLMAFQLAALLISLALNFANITSYSSKYPDAEKFLTEECGATDVGIALYRSLPTWFTERVYNNAEHVYKASQYVDENGKDTVNDDEVNKIADDMDSINGKIQGQMFIAVITMFFYGLSYLYSKRSQVYLSTLKQLKEND